MPGSTPTILLDAGANAECSAAWLVQFAQMGAAFARQRFGIAEPRVGLLSIGEEAGKGSPLVKETYALLHAGDAGPDVHFIGNVEGRDVMSEGVDVVVTDGFTGNVVLKTLEGSMKTDIDGPFHGVPDLASKLAASTQVRQCIARQWFRYTMSRYEQDPDNCSMSKIDGAFHSANDSLNSLPSALVRSDAFLYRSVQ